MPEVAIRKIRIDDEEIDPVEDVEGIKTELQIETSLDLRHLLERHVRVGVSRVAELIGYLIPFRPNGWKNKRSAGKNTARASWEDAVACFEVRTAVLLLITGYAGVIIVVAIGVEVTASRRELQIPRGLF